MQHREPDGEGERSQRGQMAARSSEWDNLSFSPAVMDAIASRAIAIHIDRESKFKVPDGDQRVSGELLTNLSNSYGISREAINEAVRREAEKAEILEIRNARRAAIVGQSGKNDLSDEQLDKLRWFGPMIDSAIRDLPRLTRASAERGYDTVHDFKIDIPVDLLKFDQTRRNYWAFVLPAVNIVPVLGTLMYCVMRCRDSSVHLAFFKHPVIESAKHERFQQLLERMEDLGIKPEFKFVNIAKVTMTARFKD